MTCEVENISKQLSYQKYIFKIESKRLRAARWCLDLPLEEAYRNDEVIGLADSQVLRWVDELNGLTDANEQVQALRATIRELRSEARSVQTKRKIRECFQSLDDLQFKPDYMFLVINRKSDYRRACKGFSINGVKYKRLVGTNGGIKNSTIVFVSERLSDELKRRIGNDRDTTKSLVTAKLEAYQALVCSASNPVSMPRGVLVVDDAETQFKSSIIYLTDEGDGEPLMEYRPDAPITIDASDGFGLMSPALAERWSKELGLDYTVSCVNTRFSFEKGVLFAFDFVDFAEKVAQSYLVKDAWGNEVDVRGVEAVFTTSMVKLWDSYASCEDYLSKSMSNGYTFSIAKTAPKELEHERNLNYQFIQSYNLSHDDIEELIQPTIQEMHDVIRGDWRKTVLFLKGSGLNADNIADTDDDYAKAIMIDPRVLDDPFVQNKIYQLIHTRINQAKVGVIKVHGNYSIVSGDPFLLCQSMFGLEKTGLLKAGEIYNAYWADRAVDKLACFRAPMTCHNNIRIVTPVRHEDARYWYRFMNTCTVLNGWDTMTAALNG